MTNNPMTELTALLAHDSSCPDQTDAYRADCIHDLRDRDIRDLLCTDIDDTPTPDEYMTSDIAPRLAELIAELFILASNNSEFYRHELSELLLSHSLCPMHHTDYAICFDDDDSECAMIRAYFPRHDT